MAFEVDDVEHAGRTLPGVSGAVIHALVALIRSNSGDAGVAQALALASEERSFAALGDTRRWTPLEDAVALFAAGALVTGDNAIALHVGGDLLWAVDSSDLAARIRSLDSPETAMQHVGTLIEGFEGAAEALALDVAPGQALVLVTPVEGGTRHAHLCELTRGFLTELPTLFDREPATVSEHECAARGGRACRYQLRWEDAAWPAARERDTGPTATGETSTAGADRAWTQGSDAGGDLWPDFAVEQPESRMAHGERKQRQHRTRSRRPGRGGIRRDRAARALRGARAL
jgi:hypothetical protein